MNFVALRNKNALVVEIECESRVRIARDARVLYRLQRD
jgi:hypothetical protein